MKKVLVDEKGKAWITCDQCKHTSAVDLSNRSAGEHLLDYKCVKCETVSEVTCEFRKSFRKEVCLNGTFVQQQPRDVQGGRIEITDISKSGIKFKTRVKYNFKPGYLLKLTFTLDDRHQTLLNQMIVVKWIDGQMVGGEFIRQEPWVQQKLGFYFMS